MTFGLDAVAVDIVAVAQLVPTVPPPPVTVTAGMAVYPLPPYVTVTELILKLRTKRAVCVGAPVIGLTS